MHSTAAAGRYPASRKRCFSSVQVTYHQEIHRPAPHLACQPLPIGGSNSCGSAEHGVEEDGHSQAAGRLVPDEDFYSPPSPPLPSSATHWDPSLKLLHDADHASESGPSVPPPNQPPFPGYHTAPHSPLFGLEDGLRQRVNVEIENFRASLQEVMREQFASQRHLQSHDPHCTHYHVKEEDQDHPLDVVSQDNEVGLSTETSINSGECVETTPTAALETTPPPSVEEEMSLALIRLQTLAAVITTNLQQANLSSSSR